MNPLKPIFKNKKRLMLAVAFLLVVLVGSFAVNTYLFTPQSTTTNATLTVNYIDGSHSTFSSGNQKSLTIIDSQKNLAVSSINANLNMIPVFTGQILNYQITPGTFSVQMLNSQNVNIYSVNMPVVPVNNLPALVSGRSIIVCSSTAYTTGTPFTSVALQQGQTYTLIYQISGFSISGTYTDGSIFGPIVAQNAQIAWKFVYESSNQFSLSVVFSLSSS